MNLYRINRLLEELPTRTAWGVCLDIQELAVARQKAVQLIEYLDIAIGTVEEFVKETMADPKKKKKTV